MRLLKFTIRNYRSCLLTILDPNNDLTTLIGVNGSGKSNLLNALLLLRNAVRGPIRYFREDMQYLNRSHVNVEIEMEGKEILLKGPGSGQANFL